MRLQDLSNDLADRQEFVIRAKLQASGNGERLEFPTRACEIVARRVLELFGEFQTGRASTLINRIGLSNEQRADLAHFLLRKGT